MSRMHGRARLSPAEQIALGEQVLEARARKIIWKVLEVETGYCRAYLWACMRQAAEWEQNSVYKHMSAGRRDTADDKVVHLRRRA